MGGRAGPALGLLLPGCFMGRAAGCPGVPRSALAARRPFENRGKQRSPRSLDYRLDPRGVQAVVIAWIKNRGKHRGAESPGKPSSGSLLPGCFMQPPGPGVRRARWSTCAPLLARRARRTGGRERGCSPDRRTPRRAPSKELLHGAVSWLVSWGPLGLFLVCSRLPSAWLHGPADRTAYAKRPARRAPLRACVAAQWTDQHTQHTAGAPRLIVSRARRAQGAALAARVFLVSVVTRAHVPRDTRPRDMRDNTTPRGGGSQGADGRDSHASR